MNYMIKEIEKEDLYDYMYVHTYAWKETYRGIIDDDFLDKIVLELDQTVERKVSKFDQIKKEEPEYTRFILYVNNEVVGAFSVSKSNEEKYPDSGELCSFYLLDKVKKQGYGRIMFERAVKELKEMNYHDMVIGCLKDNNNANMFYQHVGGKLVMEKIKNIGGKDYKENIYYVEI